jgi:hypothetical protein
MSKILRIAFLVLGISAFGQDTLATVFPKFKIEDTEASFLGDTVLVRFVYRNQKNPAEPFEAYWYNSSGKIASANVGSISTNGILGLQRSGDSIYYYTWKGDKRQFQIETFVSAGLERPITVSTIDVDGIVQKGVNWKGHFCIVTWDRNETKVFVYELYKNKAVKIHTIQLWPDLKNLEHEDVIFIQRDDPARISASAILLKLFLYDDTFCAVFDNPRGSYGVDKGMYQTQVHRKNLVTGTEDNDIIKSTDPFTFKSYLTGRNGNELYRLSSYRDFCEIVRHNLDNSKIIKQRVDVLPEILQS